MNSQIVNIFTSGLPGDETRGPSRRLLIYPEYNAALRRRYQSWDDMNRGEAYLGASKISAAQKSRKLHERTLEMHCLTYKLAGSRVGVGHSYFLCLVTKFSVLYSV